MATIDFSPTSPGAEATSQVRRSSLTVMFCASITSGSLLNPAFQGSAWMVVRKQEATDVVRELLGYDRPQPVPNRFPPGDLGNQVDNMASNPVTSPP
ncbi:MAG: hypothetical protein GXY25_02775 [Pirellulaceae bacterium]|jgi:hypothetical protein|nr:hypothetical protein [Thermoguttaceae bacterium]MDI9446339.1 hypothetical protein [Planctomycetota bacterium]NLY99441.1 hypothetical protein [Pirellulaceae bacterium]